MRPCLPAVGGPSPRSRDSSLLLVRDVSAETCSGISVRNRHFVNPTQCPHTSQPQTMPSYLITAHNAPIPLSPSLANPSMNQSTAPLISRPIGPYIRPRLHLTTSTARQPATQPPPTDGSASLPLKKVQSLARILCWYFITFNSSNKVAVAPPSAKAVKPGLAVVFCGPRTWSLTCAALAPPTHTFCLS